MIVEKSGESKVFESVLMCLGEKLEREKRESTKKLPKSLFFFFFLNEGYGGIYTKKIPFWLLGHLEGPPATLLTLAVFAFS